MKIKEEDKGLDYWKANAEEDYMTTPISVLRYITELERKVNNVALDDVSKSNSIDVETLSAKVFMLANELAIAGYGNAAVKLHTVHNGMITKGDYYSC